MTLQRTEVNDIGAETVPEFCITNREEAYCFLMLGRYRS